VQQHVRDHLRDFVAVRGAGPARATSGGRTERRPIRSLASTTLRRGARRYSESARIACRKRRRGGERNAIALPFQLIALPSTPTGSSAVSRDSGTRWGSRRCPSLSTGLSSSAARSAQALRIRKPADRNRGHSPAPRRSVPSSGRDAFDSLDRARDRRHARLTGISPPGIPIGAMPSRSGACAKRTSDVADCRRLPPKMQGQAMALAEISI
jgi:hypothetical protein